MQEPASNTPATPPLASYAYVLDRWIVPYLGRLRLRDVSRETVDQYRVEPCRRHRPTSHLRDASIDARTPEQVEAIRAAIIASARRPTDEQLRRADAVLVSVLAYKGLRPGEAFALQWSDVL